MNPRSPSALHPRARLRAARVHRLFQISVLIKGIDGVLEILGGLLLFFLDQGAVRAAAVSLTAHELSEDPGDWIAHWLRRAADGLSLDAKVFLSAYLVAHGLVKVFLVASLWRRKSWAYPTALALLGAFVLYQIYRFVHARSIGLLALTLFDLAVMLLVWFEYRRGLAFRTDGA